MALSQNVSGQFYFFTGVFSYNFFQRIIYLKVSVIEKERGREREADLPSIHSVPRWSQWPDLSKANDACQEILPGPLCGCERPKHLGSAALPFPGHYQGVGLEAEQLVLERVPIWNASIAGSSTIPQYCSLIGPFLHRLTVISVSRDLCQ